MGTSYTNIFGGALISPSQAEYNSITLTSVLQLQWPLETAPNSNLCTPLIDINAFTTGSYGLILPPATSVSVGTFLIINNLSSYPQSVSSNSGALINAAQPAGTVFFYYLQNNATAGGVWFTFQYGAAIAQPSVAQIAGPGLAAIGGQLGQTIPVSDIATPYTIGITDQDKFFNWTAGSGTLTLPLAASAGNGFYVQFRNSGTSVLTIANTSPDTINGTTPLTLNPNDSCFCVTDGLSWYTIGLGPLSQAAFRFTTINVAGLSGTYALSGTQLNQIGYRFQGTKAGNLTIIVPGATQEYWVNNLTDSTYTLYVGTSGQSNTVSPATPAVAYNGSQILYCDGSNVYTATPASAINSLPVPLSQGGTGGTTTSSAQTGLGATTIGVGVFTATTVATAQIAIASPSVADAVCLAMAIG